MVKKTVHSDKARGQFFSYDAIVAGALFLVTMSLLLSYWQGIRPNNDALVKEAEDVSTNLLSVGKLGKGLEALVLKSGSREIRKDAFLALRDYSEIDYSSLKEGLGTPNEYWIGLEGDELDCSGKCSVGREPPRDSEQSYFTRIVVFEGKTASMKVAIWR